MTEFRAMRAPFLPVRPRLILVAESPGPSGLRSYFYNPNGTKHFYSPIMRAAIACGAVLPASVTGSKCEGLLAAKAAGLMVKDIVDAPIGKKGRKGALEAALPGFVAELEELPNAKQVPLVVTPLRIEEIVVKPLRAAGFNVLGAVAFPGNGQQRRFLEDFETLVRGIWP